MRDFYIKNEGGYMEPVVKILVTWLEGISEKHPFMKWFAPLFALVVVLAALTYNLHRPAWWPASESTDSRPTATCKLFPIHNLYHIPSCGDNENYFLLNDTLNLCAYTSQEEFQSGRKNCLAKLLNRVDMASLRKGEQPFGDSLLSYLTQATGVNSLVIKAMAEKFYFFLDEKIDTPNRRYIVAIGLDKTTRLSDIKNIVSVVNDTVCPLKAINEALHQLDQKGSVTFSLYDIYIKLCQQCSTSLLAKMYLTRDGKPYDDTDSLYFDKARYQLSFRSMFMLRLLALYLDRSQGNFSLEVDGYTDPDSVKSEIHFEGPDIDLPPGTLLHKPATDEIRAYAINSNVQLAFARAYFSLSYLTTQLSTAKIHLQYTGWGPKPGNDRYAKKRAVIITINKI